MVCLLCAAAFSWRRRKLRRGNTLADASLPDKCSSRAHTGVSIVNSPDTQDTFVTCSTAEEFHEVRKFLLHVLHACGALAIFRILYVEN